MRLAGERREGDDLAVADGRDRESRALSDRAELLEIAAGLGATPMQVALAWLVHRSPNILLIPGTSSAAHLRENLAAGGLALSAQTLAALDGITAAAESTRH